MRPMAAVVTDGLSRSPASSTRLLRPVSEPSFSLAPPIEASNVPGRSGVVGPLGLSMDADQLNQLLLVGSAVLLLAILAVRVSLAAGLPSLLIYLGMGLALGDAGLGVRFSDASLAQALGFAALIVILIEG